jgi:hypothetical protein
MGQARQHPQHNGQGITPFQYIRVSGGRFKDFSLKNSCSTDTLVNSTSVQSSLEDYIMWHCQENDNSLPPKTFMFERSNRLQGNASIESF